MTQSTAKAAEIDRFSHPDARGRFGPYGGMYVPEILMTPLFDLTEAYLEARDDSGFQEELNRYYREYAGRPSPLYYADRLSEFLGGAQIYLKREDLLHTGAHKINNVIGQALLARRMGKRRIIAETGAGQHGIATAAICAKFGLECVIYMGAEDMRRQELNVYRMRLCGAEVRGVDVGQKTLKEAVNEAMRDWVSHVRTTHYILGSALGSHPYPMMVRDFHQVIGMETRSQILERAGRLPDELVACVGGGSNALGLFFEFLEDREVRLVGVEAGGYGIRDGEHAARFAGGRLGVFQGCRTWVLQTEEGQIERTHSVSAGLDYAAVGPEHAYYRDLGRIEYGYATDEEALKAFRMLSRMEGIIPAMETSHGIAYALRRAKTMGSDKILICNLSGRGDKDVAEAQRVMDKLGIEA